MTFKENLCYVAIYLTFVMAGILGINACIARLDLSGVPSAASP